MTDPSSDEMGDERRAPPVFSSIFSGSLTIEKRVFRRRRGSVGIYGIIALACLVLSLVIHFLSAGLSSVSSYTEDAIGKATEEAINKKIQETIKAQ